MEPREHYFWEVECRIDGELKKFKGTKKTLSAGYLILSGNIQKIQPWALSLFGPIDKLIIEQEESKQLVKLEWGKTAFNYVKAKKLKVSNLPALFPLPLAFKELGKNGLKSMELVNINGNIAVHANDFADFGSLKELIIKKSSFSHINQNAFTGMNNLAELRLDSNSISHFPQAINHLKGLETLDLWDNQIKQFHHVSISQLNNLESIAISGEDVKTALDSGFLNELPMNLVKLDLRNGGLTTIPTTVLSRVPQLSKLYLEKNQISVVKKDDFLHNTQLTRIVLDRNPLSQIEEGALDKLTRLENLEIRRAKLTSFDLRMVDGKTMKVLSLDGNTELVTFHVGNFKYSFTIGLLRLAKTGLRTLDAHLDELLTDGRIGKLEFFEPSPPTRIFHCDETAHWMKKHIGKSLQIDNIFCENYEDLSLEDYLKKEADLPMDTDHKNSH